MEVLLFAGAIWFWRGPAPFYFITVPAEHCDFLREAAKLVTYGWGMVPVRVRIGGTEWTTSLFPKDGGYIVPIKARVREAEGLAVDDVAEVAIEIEPP